MTNRPVFLPPPPHWGGVGIKRGEENLAKDSPPKNAFWTPLRLVRFPPRSSVVALLQEGKTSPNRKFLGRTSHGHSGVIRVEIQKLRSVRSKSWINKHSGADIHDPKALTSTTLRAFQKLWSEKPWAEVSFPTVFPVQKSKDQGSVHQKLFWRVPKLYLEGALSGRFLPLPIRFAPAISWPNEGA